MARFFGVPMRNGVALGVASTLPMRGGLPVPALSLDFLSGDLDSRITFSRGSQATLFDSTGALVYAKHNLVLQSQDFATSWTPLGSSVAQNSTSAPDATNTADTLTEDTSTGEHRIASSSVTWQGNRQYTASVYIKANGRTRVDILFGTAGNWVNGDPARSANFDLTTGTVAVAPISPASASIQDVGNGWYRCQLTVTSVTSPSASSVFIRICDATGSANYTGNGTSGLFLWGAQLNLANMEGGVTSSLTTYYPTTTAAYYAPRFDYNPSTLAPLGLLIEEQRTNSIRNNTMQGAVAGTPGTDPTNWVTASAGGAITTKQIVSVTSESGISCIDYRYVFNANGAANIRSEATTQIAAAVGQTWTASAYVKLQAGSLSNITVNILIRECDGAGATLAENTQSYVPTSANLATQRVTFTRTLSAVGTAFVVAIVQLSASGAADITLRIGLPQLEQGAFATSVIPTTTTALTRNADVASMTGTDFSSWFNATAGTLYAESFRTTTATASTFPSYAEFDNGTTNRYGVYNSQAASTNEYRLFVLDAGVSQADIGGPASRVAAGTVVKQAAAFAANDFALSVNGSSVFTDTAGALPSSVNRMSIGSSYIAANFANAWIRRVSYYPRRLPDSTLQALTA